MNRWMDDQMGKWVDGRWINGDSGCMDGLVR